MSPPGDDHALEGCGGGLRVVERRHRNPTHGRRDKSTAVGRGACVWLDWIFLSAPAHTLLPLNTKRLRKSTVAAPSVGIFGGAGPR